MAHIVVMGGGLNGLTAGILLARDGHQVTVLERDAAGPRATPRTCGSDGTGAG